MTILLDKLDRIFRITGKTALIINLVNPVILSISDEPESLPCQKT